MVLLLWFNCKSKFSLVRCYSPDFLVCDTHEEAYTKRDVSILEACENPKFFLCHSEGNVSLKKQLAYYYQPLYKFNGVIVLF